MARRHQEETVDRAYALGAAPGGLCLSIAREGYAAFVVGLPARGTVSVGRDEQAALCIESPSLSRLHFAVELDDEARIRDLGSRNGTLVEGRRLSDAPVEIAPGDEIVAGDVRFALLRVSTLPSTTRPLQLLPMFEAALASEPGRGDALGALGLGKPFYEASAGLERLAQLPSGCSVGIADATTLLVRAPDAPTIGWLARALDQAGVGPVREAVRLVAPGALPALLEEIRSRGSAPATVDVPVAFGYPSLARVHAELRRIAPRSISVLVTGETGTGKEVTAREIHRLSGRSGPLVAVNTAALPENLIESELFGHERGAFSGAQTAKVGLIESAHEGTLFLDEIGELSLALQAKLLRVLEDQSVRRVGATAERRVDLRVVAATHQDLEALTRDKRFRQDLLYRLNGATITLPPLRQRRGEIGSLAGQLLAEIAPEKPPRIDAAALAVLESYPWPGNVRELKHVLERAVAFADAGAIGVDQLPASMLAAPRPAAVDQGAGDVRATVKDFERERILEALRATGGNRTKAAEILGLPRRTLVYKLSKMRLDEE